MNNNQNESTNLLDRRSFLKFGLMTTAAILGTSASKAAEKNHGDSSSGVAAIETPLSKYLAKKYDKLLGGTLTGISDGQLKAHFALYEGYITKINELENRIKNFNTTEQDTINYRGWHLEQTSMLNGAVLHELYFANLGASDKEPKGTLKKVIDRDFGNVQNFIGHLKLVGKTFHGWSIAALNYRTGRINVYGLERHNLNVPTMVYPLLVLDVYEHAYMIDYGTDRKKYLDAFVTNLNWKAVEERLELARAIPSGEKITV